MAFWKDISTAPEGVVINTRICDENGTRNVQELIKEGNLFWFPDKSMYVYYTPNQWKPI